MIKQGKAFGIIMKDIEDRLASGQKTIDLDQLMDLMRDVSYSEYKKGTRGEDVAKVLSDFVNVSGSSSEEAFVGVVTSEHRYLQRSMFNLFYKCMEVWSKDFESGMYDDRNEGSCKLSKVMIDATN